MDILYISDFLYADIPNPAMGYVNGGAEGNDFVLLQKLAERGHSVSKKRSSDIMMSDLTRGRVYIISNFWALNQKYKDYISKNLDYIIYEHDHKYISTRNPADFKEFKADKGNIINEDFYQNANLVCVQSTLHKEIMERNISEVNIHVVGGNFWSEEHIESMLNNSTAQKNDVYSIMYSDIPHKNFHKTLEWCKRMGYQYEVIPTLPYKEFLKALSKNKYLIFNPLTPETLSRIVVEAKIMGCMVLGNKEKIGAFSEDWIGLRGEALAEVMRQKMRMTIDKIEEVCISR